MIHVMCYALASDFDAQFDDQDKPGKDFDLADMAWPRFARLTSEPSEEWMDSCRQEVEGILAEQYDDEDLPAPPEWRWQCLSTEVKAPDHIVETWGCYDPTEPDVSAEAIMVIRQVVDELR